MNVKDILAKLVAFPVLGGESNLSILTWIKDYIESFDVTVTLVPNKEENKASLHCRIGPAVDGGVILSGHMDVVPVAGQEWTSDPFKLIDKGDGRLYGRGSCDMKGFLACCLVALPDMLKADLKKPLYFAFSYDEEIGCLAAPELARAIKQHYSETPKYAIIGEPSMMAPIIGQKGIYIMETHVNGSAGHSSRIKQEVSAIHEAMRLIMWLEQKMDALIDAKNIDERFHPPHSTLHVGMIQGGIAPNVIADNAQFFWDLRTIPKDSITGIVGEYEEYCREREHVLRKIYPDFKITNIENHPAVPHLDTQADDAVVNLIQRISGQSNWDTVAYAAEAGQFANEGFQAAICGPGSIAQAHRANEYIDKEQLQKGLVMIQRLIEELSHDHVN
jgi:acetylornithine deacetylase